MPYEQTKAITKQYLYGKESIPDNLLDNSLVRSSDITVITKVNKQNFMSTGGGRFAVGRQFDLINRFFTEDSTILPVGTYGKLDVATMLGFDISNDFIGWNMNQYNYRDATDDYVERIYIYNTQSFKISDSVNFVVQENGERYIENFAIEPNINPIAPENFDLQGGNVFTNLLNLPLQPAVDPSNIGRKVIIDFTGDVEKTTYDGNSYFADLVLMNSWGGLDLVKWEADAVAMLNAFWDAGITCFLDSNNRPIIYGTNSFSPLSSHTIDDIFTNVGTVLGYPTIRDYVDNGVVFIGSNQQRNVTYIGEQYGIEVDISPNTIPGTAITANSFRKIADGTMVADSLYNITKIIGTTKDDTFTLQEFIPNLTLEGGLGEDTLSWGTMTGFPSVNVQYGKMQLSRAYVDDNFEYYYSEGSGDWYYSDDFTDKENPNTISMRISGFEAFQGVGLYMLGKSYGSPYSCNIQASSPIAADYRYSDYAIRADLSGRTIETLDDEGKVIATDTIPAVNDIYGTPYADYFSGTPYTNSDTGNRDV